MFLIVHPPLFFFFFFNDTATTEIYTLSLHDALPICARGEHHLERQHVVRGDAVLQAVRAARVLGDRSEEHTSELQSPCNLVCRLLLEKKKKKKENRLGKPASAKSITYTIRSQLPYAC